MMADLLVVGPNLLFFHIPTPSARYRSLCSTSIGTSETEWLCILVKGPFRFRELIAVSGNPHVQGREQEDAKEQSGKEATHDYNSEGPLGVRPDASR